MLAPKSDERAIEGRGDTRAARERGEGGARLRPLPPKRLEKPSAQGTLRVPPLPSPGEFGTGGSFRAYAS